MSKQQELIRIFPYALSTHLKPQSKCISRVKAIYQQLLPNLHSQSLQTKHQNSKLQHSQNQIIRNPSSQMKINSVVNKTNQTKNQILLLKAKINKLKNQRIDNFKKANRSLDQVQKINSVRERVLGKQKFQSMVIENHEFQDEKRKTKIIKFRQKRKCEIQKAKWRIEAQKSKQAEQQRKLKEEDQTLIQIERKKQLEEKITKAKTVKKFEEEHGKKMQFFYQTSKIRSHHNHIHRFNYLMNEKNNMDLILQKLKQEEELIQEQTLKSNQIRNEAEGKLKSVIAESRMRVRSQTRSGLRNSDQTSI